MTNTIVFLGSIEGMHSGGKDTTSYIKNIKSMLDFHFLHKEKKIRVSRFADFGKGIKYDIKEVTVPTFRCKISLPENKFMPVDENLAVEYCLPQKIKNNRLIPVPERPEENSQESNDSSEDDCIDDPTPPRGLLRCTLNDLCTKRFTRSYDLKTHLNWKGEKCVIPKKTTTTEEIVKELYFGANNMENCVTHQTPGGLVATNIEPLKMIEVPAGSLMKPVEELDKTFSSKQGFGIMVSEPKKRFSKKVVEWLQNIHDSGEYSTKNPSSYTILSKRMKRAVDKFFREEVLEHWQIKGVFARFTKTQKTAGLQNRSKPITQAEIDEALEENALEESQQLSQQIITKITNAMEAEVESGTIDYKHHPVEVSSVNSETFLTPTISFRGIRYSFHHKNFIYNNNTVITILKLF